MYTHPFPVLQKYKDKDKVVSNVSLILVLSVGLSVLPAVVIGNILFEREHKLKHLQIISGLNLPAYWSINMIFDIFKTMVPIGCIVGLIFAFSLEDLYKTVPIFLMYPIAVVPFTYASSFWFDTEMAGQGFTVFFNLISMSICPVAIFYLKLSEEYGYLGDKYGFYLRVLPSYSLSNSLLFCGSGDQIIKTR
jgi:hypothetical protein